MEKSKHFRSKIMKVSKNSHNSNINRIDEDPETYLITPDTTKLNHIEIKLSLLDEYVQSGQVKYFIAVTNVMEHIDKTLLKCLESRIKLSYEHKFEITSQLNLVKTSVNVDIKSDCKLNGLSNLYEFLHRGRHVILTHEYNGPNYFNELVRKLTSMAIDIDSKIIMNDNPFPEKHIDLVSLAYSIEWLSKIKSHRNNNIVFGVNSPFGDYNVSPIGHHKALKILGGLKESKDISEFHFIVKTVNFENVESKLVFLLDGKSVNVYIHDKDWIGDFNNKLIKLTKGERIRAKYKIVRSPLTKKVVAYLLTKIHYKIET